MARPQKQITLEDVANRLNWKNFIYLTDNEKARALSDCVYELVFLELSNGAEIGNADKARAITDSGDFSMLSKETQDNIASIIEYYSQPNVVNDMVLELLSEERYGADVVNKRMRAIYINAKRLDLFYKWVLSKSTNGKQNIYTVLSDSFTDYSLFNLVMPKLYRSSVMLGEKLTEKQYFEYLKQRLIVELAKDDKRTQYYFYISGKQPKDSYETSIAGTIERIKSVSYNDVHYHKTNQIVVKQDTEIAQIGYGLVAPVVDDVVKLSNATPQKQGEKLIYSLPNIDLILETVKRYPSLGIVFDKFMRVSLAYGISNGEQKFANDGIVKGRIADLMLFAGYTTDEIKEYSTRQNFVKSLNAFLEMCAGKGEEGHNIVLTKQDQEQDNGRTQIGFIQTSYTTQNGAFVFALDYAFKQMLFGTGIIKQPYSRASFRIDSQDKYAYFIYRKLEQLAGMKSNIGNNREDITTTETLISTLEEFGILNAASFRKYKERVANSIVAALDKLQDTYKLIEYYFYIDDKDKPIKDNELAVYLNKENFPSLKVWFIVKNLENYIDINKAQFTIEQQARNKKIAKKHKQEKTIRKNYANKPKEEAPKQEETREKSPYETF